MAGIALEGVPKHRLIGRPPVVLSFSRRGLLPHPAGTSTDLLSGTPEDRPSRKTLPHIPAAKEAASVPIFARSSNIPSPKAKLAMNNDIVKPIPHSQLAPKSAFHDISAGAVAKPIFTDIQANSHIPRGLPMNNPRTTPKLTGCRVADQIFPHNLTPALEKANSGITRKLTQG